MDLSDIGRSPPLRPAARPAPGDDRPASPQRWPELVARIGGEIAGPLTAALERVNTLTSTGKIDRAGLRALREEIESARQAGMVGQQLARFESVRIRQSRERLQLADVVNGVVAHRSREATARGVTLLVTAAPPVEILVDAPLLFGLLNAVVDWAVLDAGGVFEMALEGQRWPGRVRLSCRYAPRPNDDAGRARPRGVEPLCWRLLEETARILEVALERRDEADGTALVLEFPQRVGLRSGPGEIVEIDDGFAPSSNSQPLAGSHVLVIASRRDLRLEIREALRRMSLIVDFVNTVDEAVEFCRDGLPHAVIVESIQVGNRFAAFRSDIVHEVPGFVFIEILEEGNVFEASGYNGSTIARVGREVLQSSLPSALLFELSHAG